MKKIDDQLRYEIYNHIFGATEIFYKTKEKRTNSKLKRKIDKKRYG